ncbi:MAG: 16S rRNA (cytidine(1402)-2'-O)-methyltransferase [Pyrinomonadaceae bacterium]|nr:16S rRNA (cytidine(1402)-2'-O)-methyltransferase [Pyrinomonadaceae bacterium]
MAGTLYVVSTPIGNLEDLTYRAVRVLSEVDIVACEDTRHSQKLLHHYGIKTKTVSYHEHNERDRAGELLASIKSGLDVAVVSDAGTPGISDPGFRVVRMALEAGLQVVPIPGPTALVSALVASGLPSDEFFFAGFLPARSGARRSRLADLVAIPSTLVFYEAPHRLVASLVDVREILGEREAVVARELTKLHEEIVRGRLSEIVSWFSQAGHEPRGEMVVVIDRKVIAGSDEETKSSESVASIVASFEAEGLDPRSALKKSARQLGISRDEAYRRLTAERSREKP